MLLSQHTPIDARLNTPPFSGSPIEAQSRHLRRMSVGSQVIGALAVGAVAIGAIAIGALAIGRLTIGRSRIRRLEIDELVVGKLRVTDVLETPSEPKPDS